MISLGLTCLGSREGLKANVIFLCFDVYDDRTVPIGMSLMSHNDDDWL